MKQAKQQKPDRVRRGNTVFIGGWVPEALSEAVDTAVKVLDSDRSKFLRIALNEKVARETKELAEKESGPMSVLVEESFNRLQTLAPNKPGGTLAEAVAEMDAAQKALQAELLREWRPGNPDSAGVWHPSRPKRRPLLAHPLGTASPTFGGRLRLGVIPGDPRPNVTHGICARHKAPELEKLEARS